MKRFAIWYYNLFQWENGENTHIQFTIGVIVLLVVLGIEIYNRAKKHKSIFF